VKVGPAMIQVKAPGVPAHEHEHHADREDRRADQGRNPEPRGLTREEHIQH